MKTTNTGAVPGLPDDLDPEIVRATAAFIGQITGLVPPPHDAFPPEWYGYLRMFTARVKEIASENSTPPVQANHVVEPEQRDTLLGLVEFLRRKGKLLQMERMRPPARMNGRVFAKWADELAAILAEQHEANADLSQSTEQEEQK